MDWGPSMQETMKANRVILICLKLYHSVAYCGSISGGFRGGAEGGRGHPFFLYFQNVFVQPQPF